MIKVVHSGNRRQFAEILERQFRLRHEIFVKGRGWVEFEQDGIYEKDQYDNESATYLIAIDELQNVVGCFRLYPTVLPHMLSEHFAYLVQRGIPKENDLFELTRFAIHKSQRGSPHYFELLTAIQEYGLRERLAGYTAIINTLRLPILQGFGFDIEPLGLPQTVGSETMIAVLLRVSQDCLSSVRRLVNVHSSVFDDMTAKRRIA